jgi:transcriptional regulator with XRE-family HTH domain
MFNMERVGKKITELRKTHNMTQMELADKMGISFQAVSNWERGNSMPDISKLPELALMFDVSIDELLGEKSKLFESIVYDKTQEYLNENEITAEELIGIAPLIRTEQADEIVKVIEPKLDYSEIMCIVPFLSEDVTNQLFMKCMEQGDEPHSFYPFVSEECLQKAARIAFETKGLTAITTMAPFLDTDFLTEIAKDAIEQDGLKSIQNIAPFVDGDLLSQYIKDKYL